MHYSKEKTFILLLASMMLTACESSTNQDPLIVGPGHGGTGPFITSSEEVIAMNYPSDMTESDDFERTKAESTEDHYADSIAAIFTITGDADSKEDSSHHVTNKPQISIVSQSDKQECSGFSRSIQAYTRQKITDLNTTNNSNNNQVKDAKRTDELVVYTKVSNLLDSEHAETRNGCYNYSVVDMNGQSLINAQCSKSVETLPFLPKQTHDYSLILSGLQTGKYLITYTNLANAIPSENVTNADMEQDRDTIKNKQDCYTFIEIIVP